MAVQLFGFNQLKNQLISGVLTNTGLNSLYTGSTLSAILEQVAQSDYQVYNQIIEALKSNNLDSVVGADLDNLGFQFGVAREQAIKSIGFITIIDSSITKIATQIYAASAPPVVGDSVIKVSDASNPKWALSGSKLYIGRGTSNLEGPINIVSVAHTGSFYTITLGSPLTKNHLNSETVILAQNGDRLIKAGTTVSTSDSNSSPAITFATQQNAVLADGEDTLTNIQVVASNAGTQGNIPVKAIVKFSSDPFPNATVFNPLGFSSGADIESDEEYRTSIKNTIQSLSRGVETALETAVSGVQDPTNSAIIKSATVVEPITVGKPATLYVSSDTGLEPSFAGVGQENLIVNAAGGEEFFQVQNLPVTRPQLESTVIGPYGAIGGETLSVSVTDLDNNNVPFTTVCTVVVPASFITTPGAAQVTEIANALNSAANITSGTRNFFARTAESGTHLLLFTATYSAISIQIISGTLNNIVKFPTVRSYSIKIYKDDILLNQGPDYIFNRFSGQGRLTNDLTAGESLSAGSAQTRAFLRSASQIGGTIAFSLGSHPGAWMVADADVTFRSVTLPIGTTLTVVQSGDTMSITAATGTPWANVQIGDYILIKSPNTDFSANNQGMFEVIGTLTANLLEVKNPSGTTQAPFLTTLNTLIVIFQSDNPPQLLDLTAQATGTSMDLITLVDAINAQAEGYEAAVYKNTKIQLNSLNYDVDSELTIIASFDDFKALLGFTQGMFAVGEESQTGFAISQRDTGSTIPNASGSLTAATGTSFTDVQDSTQDFTALQQDILSGKVHFLDGNDHNISQAVQEVNSATDLTIRDNVLKSINQEAIGNLYGILKAFDFDDNDQLVVIVDQDKVSKTFSIPMYRSGTVNTSLFSPTTTQFSGNDEDAAVSTPFGASFTDAKFFDDFKIWFKSSKLIIPTGSNNEMRIVSSSYGPNGDNYYFGIFYPAAPNTPIAATYEVAIGTLPVDATFIKLTLGSGSAVLLTADSTTQIAVSNPSGNNWTYTYTGTGTNPGFGSLTVGNIINIQGNFSTNNKGVYRVTNVTPTSFTVVKTGGTVETIIITTGAFSAYSLDNSGNKASAAKTAIDALGIITTTVALPGSDGTGSITLSSKDDPMLASTYLQLGGGENFILSYNTSSPFFQLKEAFAVAPSNGDQFRLLPVTAINVNNWLNKPSVTALSIVANIDLIDNGRKIELSTKTLGRAGSINVTGAKANSIASQVLTPAINLNNSNSIVKFPRTDILGFHKGMFIEFDNAAGSTIKDGNFNTSTNVRTYISSGNQYYLFYDTTGSASVQTQKVFTGTFLVKTFLLPNGYLRLSSPGAFINVQQGDQVVLDGAFNAANQGKYLVIENSNDYIDVKNPGGVEEIVTTTAFIDIRAYSYDSFMDLANGTVGDTLQISRPSGAWFTNHANSGSFPILLVDQPLALNVLATYGTGASITVTGTGPYTLTSGTAFTNIPAPNDFVIYNSSTILQVTSSSTNSVTGNLVTGTTVPTSNTAMLTFINAAIKVNNPNMVNGDSLSLSSSTLQNIEAIDNYPWFSVKKIDEVVLDPINLTQAYMILSPANDTDNISSNFGTTITGLNKLGFNTDINQGLDGYTYHTGIIQRAQRITDGYSADPITFPGIKAAGTVVEVLPPVDFAIKVALQVALNEGVTLVAVADTIRTAAISYINSLGIGKPVILSQIINVVSDVAGVESVKLATTTPAVAASGDRISVGPNQKAKVLLPTDVVVSEIGT